MLNRWHAALLALGLPTALFAGPVLAGPPVEGRFTAPEGRTLLFIGQDSDTIAAYVAEVPEDPLEGVTLYTSLKSDGAAQALPAVFSKADWNAGDVDFGRTLADAPGAALAIGLAIDACGQDDHAGNIAEGRYDRSLARLVDYMKALAPRKVFLRIGYEFDGPWNCYRPDSYKAAFAHITRAVRKAGAVNVATVWQSAAWPDASIAGAQAPLYDHRAPTHLDAWYPGDELVDWVGVSVFYRDLSQWAYVPPDRPEHAQERLLAFARAHGKPVMIAEAAPQGLRTGALTRSVIQRNEPVAVSAEQAWDGWYAPFFRFIDDNRDVIRAVAYINADWQSQKMWECAPDTPAGQPGCANGNWGDSRVQANDHIRARWLEQVSNPDTWAQKAP